MKEEIKLVRDLPTDVRDAVRGTPVARRRDRAGAATIPVAPLPSYGDPIWRLGADVVRLVTEYLDADAESRASA